MHCFMKRNSFLLIKIYLLFAFEVNVVDAIARDCDGCCKNYFHNKDNNSCDPCPPGTYGNNCSLHCPPNYYGQFCKNRCNCSTGMVCFPTAGCLHPTTTTMKMNADEVGKDKNKCSKLEKSKCCWNYFFNINSNRCDPCLPGTFGDNCEFPCPKNYYGYLCRHKCNCGIGIPCLPTTGCVDPNTASRHGGVNTLPSHVIIIIICCLICVAVIISCYFRYRKPDMFQTPFDAGSSVNNRLQCDATTDVVSMSRRGRNKSPRSKGVQNDIENTEGSYNEILSAEMDISIENTARIYTEI